MPSAPFHSPICRVYEEAFNQGNLAAVDKMLTPSYFAHNALAGNPKGPQGLKSLITIFGTAFPDLQCMVENETREGDKVAAVWTVRGTHKGVFMGNSPTGRPFEIQGIIFTRIENGRIAEDWTLMDQMGILQQLGIIPY
jgi:steroid delta-isomerase-like uncharacterized protein